MKCYTPPPPIAKLSYSLTLLREIDVVNIPDAALFSPTLIITEFLIPDQ